MHKEWYATSELAGLPGLPKNVRNITIKAKKESWDARKRQAKGGGQEYHLSSLPLETQAALLKASQPNVTQTPVKAALNKAKFDYNSDELWQHYDKKPQKQKDTAEKKLKLLQQVMALAETADTTLKQAFAIVAEQNDISERTMHGWYHGTSSKKGVKHYQKTDWLAALVPGFVGRTATAEMSEEAWQFLKADYLCDEKPELEACIYRLQRTAAERGWILPSKKTIERRINAIPMATRVYLREGEAGLVKLFPAQQRTVEELHALQWINGDGYQHNVFVKLPNGDITRMKTWFWQDVYSRKILAYRVDESENTDTIRASFGDVVDQFGIPEHVTIDNTRAAANKWMTGGVPNRYRFKVKEDDPLGLLPTLGIKVHWTSVIGGKGHGQAKPIERAFGVGGLGEYVDKHPAFRGAYTGPNPMAKPENYGSKAIDIDTFLSVLEQEIIAWNAKPNRRTEVAGGEKSYDQVFIESYKNAVIRTANEEQRRMWLLMAEAIKVQKDGTFTLDAGSATGQGKNRYHNPELFEFTGHKVTVRFDPQALHETVYVYTLDNRYICQANCIEATGFGDTEAARSFNKHRTRFIKASKLAAKAEVAMDALEVAEMLPQAPQPEVANPKIVRPLRAEPKVGRVAPQPQYSEQDISDFESFQQEFNQPAQVLPQTDDPRARYQRWQNLNKRLHEGQQLQPEDQKFWAMYQKGSEFKTMQELATDFEGYDLTVEA